MLPPENLSDGRAPPGWSPCALDQVVAMAGAEVIGGAQVDDYLARYRIRYTGGIDAIAARAARDDLGADAVLVTTVELSGAAPASHRAHHAARVHWRGAPGPLDGRLRPLRARFAGALQHGDRRRLPGAAGGGPGGAPKLAWRRTSPATEPGRPRCPGGGWFRPRLAYRARPDERAVATVAVLPFVNQTRRRGAGEIVALEFARQFAATDGFRLLEPGVVRDELLRRRIVMEDGVSLDQARLISGTLEADLVVAGYVFEYDDAAGAPASNFTVLVIDRKTSRVVWESTSFNRGTDSATLFELNVVSTAPRLSCRMVREVIDGIDRGEGQGRPVGPRAQNGVRVPIGAQSMRGIREAPGKES